jgi:hypothetical protein
MPTTPILPFISNEDLINETRKVIEATIAANNSIGDSIYSNVVDPFSAIFDSLQQDMALTEWLANERTRQIAKTIQNKLGTFHQEILGCIPGWKSLGVGEVVDLVNDERKIVAEVKNKHNTTKGNHKKDIYDDLVAVLNTDKNRGYVGYYVEVIPATRNPYNKPFTPPDNLTHTDRTARDDIRVIDGKSFYALASGYPNAIDLFYKALPLAIATVLGKDASLAVDDSAFQELFYRAYLQ